MKEYYIPERYRFNYLNMEMLEDVLKDRYSIEDEKFWEELHEIVSSFIESSINSERGKWLGMLKRTGV